MKVDQIKSGFKHVSHGRLFRFNSISHFAKDPQKLLIGTGSLYMDLIPDHAHFKDLWKIAKSTFAMLLVCDGIHR